MGCRRLLPLLALLGAAGLKSSEWEGSAAQEPGTTTEPEHLFPRSAEPYSSTQKPTARSLLLSLLPPSLPASSADPEASRGGVPRGATAMEQGRLSDTAGGRTQSPTPDAGRTERTGPPSTLGASLQPQPALPSATTSFWTLFPMLLFLPVSISPKDVAAAPASGHASASEGFSRSDLEERTPKGWPASSPSVRRGSREQVVNETSSTEMGPLSLEPGSESLAGATAAGNETSRVVIAEDLRMPAVEPSWLNGASSLMFQESKTSPPTAETQNILLFPTWQPAMDATDPTSTGSPNPSETLGPEGEVSIAMTQITQLEPRDQSSSPLVMRLEPLPQQPGGSKAHVQLEVTPDLDPEAGPTEPGVAVGSLSPGMALQQTLAGVGHRLEISEEAAVPDSTGRSTEASLGPRITALGQRTKAAEEVSPPSSPAPASSAVTLNHGADGTEAASRSSSTSFSSSSGATVPLSPVGSTAYPPGSDNALFASNPTLGSSLLTLSIRLPEDSTEGPGALGPGQDASVAMTTHQRSTDRLPVAGTGLFWVIVPQDGPAVAMGETRGSQETPGSSESFRTWSAQSSPGPTHFPLQGAFSGPAPSSAETSASLVERGWAPADSGKEPQKVPAVCTEQTVREGSTPDAASHQTSQSATDGTSVGPATEKVQPPVSQNPGRSGGSSEPPSLTEFPTGSETASLSAEGAILNLAHSENPEFVPSQMTVFSTSASKTAVPASETGAAAASDQLLVTLRPGVPPARTQRWESGRRPIDPTESNVREELTHSPHSSGPVQPTATSGPHTWPSMPVPEPGSASRGDPAIASTWLFAPVPAEASAHPVPAVPNDARSKPRQVFVVENQPPLLKAGPKGFSSTCPAAFLHVPCELVLAMEFSKSFWNARSSEYQGLVLSINETVAPLFASLPGFQRLEVKTIRPGSVVVEFDALFQAEASGLWAALNQSWLSERLPPGLQVASARVLRSTMLERPLDLCAVLFSCHAGYECVAGEDGNAVCTSMCHRDYCQNQGICTHEENHIPVCQCPVGSDFWFLGMRCNYKVTQQGLLGVACGLLLSLVVVGMAIASLVVRRVRMLLLEARADQTKSSYRRFCRLDDVSAHYWSEPWLASASSLDNPAFSNSEELLHLQILDTNCCSYCQDDCVAPNSYCTQLQDTPCISVAGRPR